MVLLTTFVIQTSKIDFLHLWFKNNTNVYAC